MRALLLLIVLIGFFPFSGMAEEVSAVSSTPELWLENMTWQEVQSAIAAGNKTVIIPTGGTEQNGPHLVLGKHNVILRYTAPQIAKNVGATLIAPIMPYVPEGGITPPQGHMRFAGTLSLRQETFAAFLEDTARSLKQHGFKLICFVGEHGASQAVQAQVAEKLSDEWKNDGVIVLQVSHYYDEGNGQVAWLKSQGETEPDPEAHGGLADTAEMSVAYPQGVRANLRKPYTKDDENALGVAGSGMDATPTMGAKLLALKITGAVNQIHAAQIQLGLVSK